MIWGSQLLNPQKEQSHLMNYLSELALLEVQMLQYTPLGIKKRL